VTTIKLKIHGVKTGKNYVDYMSGKRTPKQSAWWYREHIARCAQGGKDD
jgi:beta-glucosidase/6-phospho-beta-glucosidase/beta-galactosidase